MSLLIEEQIEKLNENIIPIQSFQKIPLDDKIAKTFLDEEITKNGFIAADKEKEELQQQMVKQNAMFLKEMNSLKKLLVTSLSKDSHFGKISGYGANEINRMNLVLNKENPPKDFRSAYPFETFASKISEEQQIVKSPFG